MSVDLDNEAHIIVTMFVSSEHGIRIQDIKPTDLDVKLLALATPYVVVLKKLDIVREVLSDFVGLDQCTLEAKRAVLDFSYNLCLGMEVNK